jgi:hypothetical protein
VQGEVFENLVDRAVLELAPDLAEESLCLIAHADAIVARLDLTHAALCPGDREENAAREEPVEQEELGVPSARNPSVGAQVGLVCANAAKDRRPRRTARLGERSRREKPRRHVCAFDAAPQSEEAPRLVPARRRLDDSDGEGGALANPAEEFMDLVARDLAGHPCPGRVEHLPELGAHDLAGPSGILAGSAQGIRDRRRLGAIDGEDGEHIIAGQIGVFRYVRAHDRQQGPAREVLFDPRVFEQQLQVHIEDARRAVGALDVATDPEQALGDSAQHVDTSATDSLVRSWRDCCCCSCWSFLGPSSGE